MTDTDKMNIVMLAEMVYVEVEYATSLDDSKIAEKAALIHAAEKAEVLAKALRKHAGQPDQAGKAGE